MVLAELEDLDRLEELAELDDLEELEELEENKVEQQKMEKRDMESFEEFNRKVRKIGSKGLSRIRNSIGVYDFYKAIRRHGWFDIGRPLTEKEYYAIVRGVNKLLAEELAQGGTVVLPSKMGRLELHKLKTGVRLDEEGKLHINYKINWEDTIRLWYEDGEAYKEKTLCRFDKEEYIYFVKYCREEATYENQCFYQFEVNRNIKRGLKENIKKGGVDALWEKSLSPQPSPPQGKGSE